jgi:hypothetical protein
VDCFHSRNELVCEIRKRDDGTGDSYGTGRIHSVLREVYLFFSFALHANLICLPAPKVGLKNPSRKKAKECERFMRPMLN